MPTSKHRKPRSPKPARRPAKTAESAPQTLPPAPAQPYDPPQALPALQEMSGNERENDLSILSPRQQAALPIVACIPTIAQAARAANVGESTLRRWFTEPAFRGCVAELRRQSANVARQKLIALTPLCISVLADAMQHPDPAIRLRAVHYTLSFDLRATELENLRSDLDRLETALSLPQ